jgi:hypothetical protein
VVRILSYKLAVDRIACERERRLSALRDEVLTAIYWKLSQFNPNHPGNIRHPWKERHSLRAWCPRHNGRWVKLIVKAGEPTGDIAESDGDGHVTFECDAGCNAQEIRDYIADVGEGIRTAGAARIDRRVTESASTDSEVGAGAHRQVGRGSTKVLDAQHRFSGEQPPGGPCAA